MSTRNTDVSKNESSAEDAANEAGRRRRGDTLVNAILDAAWVELKEAGLAALTMESVAARAGTSRPVLYRRWPDRVDLAIAAIRHYVGNHPVAVPDMGSVREELFTLARKSMDRGMPLVFMLLLQLQDHYRNSQTRPLDLRTRVLGNEQDLLDEIIERGITRGEIDPSRLTPRRKFVVTDVIRHQLLMTLSPVSDTDIYEVIDELFLPLVRP